MAINVIPTLLLGQSNANGQGVDGYPILNTGDGYYSSGSNIVDFETSAPTAIKTSVMTKFIQAETELNPDIKTIAMQVAFDGSSLLSDTWGHGNGDWSLTGTHRYTARTQFDNLIALIGSNPLYNIVGVRAIWLQGEAEAAAMASLVPITPAQYTTALIEIKNWFKTEINLDDFYVSALGQNPVIPQYGNIRQAQLDAETQDSEVQIACNIAQHFQDYGWKLDDAHYNQFGLNKIGLFVSEFANGTLTQKTLDSKYTEVVNIEDEVVYNKFDNLGQNEVILGNDMTFVGDVTTPASIFTDTGDELMFSSNDNTGWSVLSPSPFQKQSWTISQHVQIPVAYNISNSGTFFGDVDDGNDSGVMLVASTGKFRLLYNNGGAQSIYESGSSINAMKGVKSHVLCSYDGTNVVVELNGIEVINTPADITPSSEAFNLSNSADFSGAGLPFPTGLQIDMVHIYNRILSPSEKVQLQNELTDYNIINTPVTPAAPIITDENNDTNTFTFTPATSCEITTDNGANWLPELSPFDVGRVDIPLGHLQARVAAEGVNPVSPETPSTIEWTEATQIDRTKIFVYASDLNIPLEDVQLICRLVSPVVQYKDAAMYSESLTFDPDANGKIEFDLPDTDSMTTDEYYIIDFGRGVRSKTQVNKTNQEVNLFALPNYQRI